MRFIVFVSAVFLCTLSPLAAQNFGFGFDDESGEEAVAGSGERPLAVSMGGEVSASLVGYVHDFSEGATHTRLGDIFSGRLNFSAETSHAEGVINLKLQSVEQPFSIDDVIDEAYVRAYFGNFDIEGGLRKLTWGKTDSPGPLDIINSLDYSEMTNLRDTLNRKIARPLIHATYRIGSFSKIEGVFVPTFEPLRFAEEGRWVPAQMRELDELIAAAAAVPSPPGPIGIPVNRPDTTTLDYAQAGARFTTTIGPTDIGFQYYYGHLTRPAVTMGPPLPSPLADLPSAINFAYNPYHQVGVDWAQILSGFNTRAELAANITEDLEGDDGAVYNPSLVWSFGFDRGLFWEIDFNVQANESIKLLYDKLNNDPFQDIEADTDMTSTQIITALSKKFFRNELEARVAVMWEVEAKDFLLMPSLIWTKDAVSIELSGGIFGGEEDGQFGQYRDNGFVKAVLTYTF
jgi:hypothetical protein